jgi:purine-binding chemotaxis protein CheW
MEENQTGAPIKTEPFILFELAGTTYGVRSQAVQQVELVEHITPVPNAPAAVEGIVFSRGQVIPAINLRARFGFEKTPHTLRTRLIVTSTQGRVIGLIVDSAREFVALPASAIQPPNEAIAGLQGRYLEGIATLDGRLILILHLDEIIDLAETIVPAPESA